MVFVGRILDTAASRQIGNLADLLLEMVEEEVLDQKYIKYIINTWIIQTGEEDTDYPDDWDEVMELFRKYPSDWEKLDHAMWKLYKEYNADLSHSEWMFMYDDDTNNLNLSEDQIKLKRLFEHVQDKKRTKLLQKLGLETEGKDSDIDLKYIENVKALWRGRTEMQREKTHKILEAISELTEPEMNSVFKWKPY